MSAKIHFSFLLSLSLLFASTGCRRAAVHNTADTAVDTVILHYAKGFSIVNFENFRRIDIYSPWTAGKTIQQRYYLVSDDSISTPSDGMRVHVPVGTWATASCTHIGFLGAVDELQRITGVTNPGIIYNDTIRSRYSRGLVTDIGDALNINTEVLLALHPDMLILNLIGSNDTQAGHISNVGTNILYNNEWKETTPLARAEWIKLFGAMSGKDALADSFFCEVEKRYTALCEHAGSMTRHPSLFSGGDFRGTWYVPSGNTYMGYLFADAGAEYAMSGNTSTESIPLTMEQALTHFAHADVWVGAPAVTYEELLAQQGRYNMLDAVKNHSVYNFYGRTKHGGANDFWETGVVRPDLILGDLLVILYGTAAPCDSLVFSKALE